MWQWIICGNGFADASYNGAISLKLNAFNAFDATVIRESGIVKVLLWKSNRNRERQRERARMRQSKPRNVSSDCWHSCLIACFYTYTIFMCRGPAYLFRVQWPSAFNHWLTWSMWRAMRTIPCAFRFIFRHFEIKTVALALNVCYKSMRICVQIWCSLYQSSRFLHLHWNSHFSLLTELQLKQQQHYQQQHWHSSLDRACKHIIMECKSKHDPAIHIHALSKYFLTNDEQTKQNWTNFFSGG